MNQTDSPVIQKSKKPVQMVVAALWAFIVFTLVTVVYINSHKPIQKAALNSLPDLSPNTEDKTTTKVSCFVFNNESLQTLLPKIVKPYHMDIVYTSPELKNMRLSGAISKKTDITQALEVLKIALRIEFKVEGNKLLVLPNPYRKPGIG